MDFCFRMIRSNFLSREDRRELLACVKRQREDHGVARRANVLLLLNDEAVYFAPSRRFQANTCQAIDAVHPEYQSKPAFGWVKKGTNPTLKTTAGRARVNIHGALNLETFDTPFVAPVTVDGVSAVQLLAKIEARNQDKRIIHVIWDNAAYHKGPDVRAFLSRKNCRIHLIQLPPYCPHLNPIERLWAVMHQHVTHNRAYPTQKLFTEAILKFFRKIIPEQWRTRTKVLGVGGDLDHRVRAGAHQQIVDLAFVLMCYICDLLGQCEDQVKIPHRQQFCLARRQPCLGCTSLTFWAVTIAA